MKKYDIAVVGASGLVGQTFLKILDEEDFPLKNLYLFGGKNSTGKKIFFKEKEYENKPIEENAPHADFTLLATDQTVSRGYVEKTKTHGVIIDNSSAFRMDKAVPLVVPEINIKTAFGQKLIANPNCTTAICAIPLSVLHSRYGLKKVRFFTYQSVSGSGKNGLSALECENDFYKHDIRQTCIPQIGSFGADGYTEEETKMKNELRKILNLRDLPISATCVRVPVKYCHAIAVSVVLQHKFNIADVIELFNATDGLTVCGGTNTNEYPASTVGYGSNEVYVGRIRKDDAEENALLFYALSDNLRRGAAYNAYKIINGLIDRDERI